MTSCLEVGIHYWGRSKLTYGVAVAHQTESLVVYLQAL